MRTKLDELNDITVNIITNGINSIVSEINDTSYYYSGPIFSTCQGALSPSKIWNVKLK